MNIAPSLEEKKQIIENAMKFVPLWDWSSPRWPFQQRLKKRTTRYRRRGHGKTERDSRKDRVIRKRRGGRTAVLTLPWRQGGANTREWKAAVAGDTDVLFLPHVECVNGIGKWHDLFRQPRILGGGNGIKAQPLC